MGWKVVALYAATGLSIAVAAGWTIGRPRIEGHIKGWGSQMNAAAGASVAERMTWPERIR